MRWVRLGAWGSVGGKVMMSERQWRNPHPLWPPLDLSLSLFPFPLFLYSTHARTRTPTRTPNSPTQAANLRSQSSKLDARIEQEHKARARYEQERASQGNESAELRKRIAAVREALRKGSPLRLLKIAFSKFDGDGSGKLTADEVAQAIAFTRREGEPGVSTEDVERFIRYRDTDGDGEINFAEFSEYFGQLS